MKIHLIGEIGKILCGIKSATYAEWWLDYPENFHILGNFCKKCIQKRKVIIQKIIVLKENE